MRSAQRRGTRLKPGAEWRGGRKRLPQRHQRRRLRRGRQLRRVAARGLPGAQLIDQLAIDLVVAREQQIEPTQWRRLARSGRARVR